MTYQQWEKLTPDEQNNTPESELPSIPEEELNNFLIHSKMIIRAGERFWEIMSQGETETKLFPEYKQKEVAGIPTWYKFNPRWGTYEMNLEGEEPSMTDEPIGTYGMAWIKWMEENHKSKVASMRLKHKFLTVARSVDKAAWEYRNLLDEQYEQANPRPYSFEEIVEWERTRAFHTDSAVMRERVLIAVTEA